MLCISHKRDKCSTSQTTHLESNKWPHEKRVQYAFEMLLMLINASKEDSNRLHHNQIWSGIWYRACWEVFLGCITAQDRQNIDDSGNPATKCSKFCFSLWLFSLFSLKSFKVNTIDKTNNKHAVLYMWIFFVVVLLAHPVRRTRWAYAMPWRPSSVRPSFRPSVLPSVHSFQNASSSSFLNRFWFWLFHKIGLGGGFKTSTQNCEIHYLW